MYSNPILSIVVPTINRYETLVPLIKSLMEWDNNEFELIIHDNSEDHSHIKTLLEMYENDSRLKYFHVSERLSAIENCDMAVAKAQGYYVCFIGDDDGVIPQAIDVCKWMSAMNIDSMYCNIGFYTWPGTGHSISVNNGYNGKLILQKITGKITFINPQSELKKVIRSGAQSLFQVPRLYQGIVSKKSLDDLFSSTKTYFPGPVPDMSNAIACNSYIRRHCFIDLPIIISGHSKKSMSGKNSLRLHQGEIKNEKSLPTSTESEWSEKIPFFWSAPTIWAEAAIRASINTGNTLILNEFNYGKLYAHCFAYCNSIYYKRIFNALYGKRNFFGMLGVSFNCLYNLMVICFKRFKTLFLKFTKGIEGTQCETISEAIKETNISVGSFDQYIVSGKGFNNTINAKD